MDTRLSHRPGLLFLAAAGLVVATEALVVQTSALGAHPELLGGAVAFDLVVLVPALWAWLMVRPGRARAVSVVPVAVAAWLVAKALLPDGAEGGLRAAAELAPLLEAGLVLYVGVRARRVVRAYRSTRETDPLLRLREAVGSVLGAGTAARLLADEVTMIRYLVRPPRDAVPPGAEAFGYHRRSGWGAVVAALSMAAAAEVVTVHALVSRWSVAAAWALTGLGVYGFLWLVADWRATRTRPLLLDADDGTLLVRAGLRWTARVPLGSISDARRAGIGERLDGEEDLSTAVMARPALVVTLSRPVRVEGPFGIEREVSRLGLAADAPGELASALEAAADA